MAVPGCPLAIIDAGVLVSMGLPGTIVPPTPKAGGGWIVYILFQDPWQEA